MDSRYYGTPYFIDEIEERLSELTLEQVNGAARKYLQTRDYVAVLVTRDAAAVHAYLEADEPSLMTYNTEVAPEILEEDQIIQEREVAPTAVRIVPVGEVFQH